MIKKKIFYKSKKNKINIFFYLLILLFLLFIYYYFIFLNNNNKFVIIPENNNIIYIVPEDKGGEKVPNLDKKSLNLNQQQQIETNNMNKQDDFPFSIQFYTNNYLKDVAEYLNKLSNIQENIYSLDDFYILVLNSDIGIDYFLLYKNFETREAANSYCLKYLKKIEKCLIVNTTKF